MLRRWRKPARVAHSDDEEGRDMLAPGTSSDVPSALVTKIQDNILNFSSTTAREIMVPRVDIVGIEEQWQLKDIAHATTKNGHSRYPVYKKDLDNIDGILNIRDLFPFLLDGKAFDLPSILRHPLFIPESKRIDNLLVSLQSSRVPMAIVVDEYGGVSGLVTIEDILEELVGEIHDEHDAYEDEVTLIGPGTFRVSARTSLEDLIKQFHIILISRAPESVETVGGFVQWLLGKIPAVGDEITIGTGYKLKVADVSGNRLHWMHLTCPARSVGQKSDSISKENL